MNINILQKLIAVAFVSVAIGPALASQTLFETSLARHRGNKVVLLGDWRSADVTKWGQTLDSDEIYGYSLTLLDRAKLSEWHVGLPTWKTMDVDSFESWFRQKYGLGGSAKWAALDAKNQLIFFGAQTPSPKELDKLLENRGIKTTVRQIMDFLKENPSHLDAMSDLLKEVRRRAMRVMPKDANKDLNDETDLRTWAVMASETDKVFSGQWLGIGLAFFSPDADQPEQFSKQMRAVFRKHIPKVESAIRLEPTNNGLWNIWCWMARGMGDYKWDTFINSLEPLDFSFEITPLACPSPEACVWLVADAATKRDWHMVVKLAKIARHLKWKLEGEGIEQATEWSPDGWTRYSDTKSYKDYPFKSAYAPHLEALLRLGDVDQANIVYDEMIRWGFTWGFSDSEKPEYARAVAEIAKSAGMEELAKLWEKFELINKVPYRGGWSNNSYFYVFTEWGSDFQNNLNALLGKLRPPTMAAHEGPWKDDPRLGWRVANGERWGLIGRDGLLIAQGTDIPELETMQALWESQKIESQIEEFRRVFKDALDQPGVALDYSFLTISDTISSYNYDRSRTAQNSGQKVNDDNEKEYNEAINNAARRLRKVMYDYPSVLVNLPPSKPSYASSFCTSRWPATWDNPTIKALSGPFLEAIEALLERKPSSEPLWSQWIFWRSVGGNERRMESLVTRLRYSPLREENGGLLSLPALVLNTYWNDCKKDGSWDKVIELLKPAWERDLQRVTELKNGLVSDDDRKRLPNRQTDLAGDRIGIHLIEAYLNYDRPGDASEVFNAWIAIGGNFKDTSKIVELATAKGQERLALEWGKARGQGTGIKD